LRENRHRLLLGIKVASLRGPAAETDGGRAVIDRFQAPHDRRIQPVGADTGYFAKPFLTARVRRRSRTVGDRLSPRARKKIEALRGEAKGGHGFRRFQRRGLRQVRDAASLMGWLLNLKRLAKWLPAPA
jgi:hypothetical protein